MWKLQELDVWPVSVEMGELRNSQRKPERSWRRTTMKRKVLRNLNIKTTWEFQQLLFPHKCGWQPCRYTYLCCALGVAVAEVSGADQISPPTSWHHVALRRFKFCEPWRFYTLTFPKVVDEAKDMNTVRASGGSTCCFGWKFWIVEPSKQIFFMQFWRFHAQLLTDAKVAGPLCGDHIFRSFLDCKRPTIHLAIMWWSSLSSFSSCDHHPRISPWMTHAGFERPWIFIRWNHWPGEVWRNTTTVWVIWRRERRP